MSEPFMTDLVELLRKHGVENATELARFMYASLSHLVTTMQTIAEVNRARAAAAVEPKEPPPYD
jgi:hypothetical protein